MAKSKILCHFNLYKIKNEKGDVTMKKKSKRIVALAAAILILCAILCPFIPKRQESAVESEQLLQMRICADLVAYYLQDSNGSMLNALNAYMTVLYEKTTDASTAEKFSQEALELVDTARQTMVSVISPSEETYVLLTQLYDNYKATTDFFANYSEKSEQEKDNFLNLAEEGVTIHTRLIRHTFAFAFLYSIREYDALPEKEAAEYLRDKWESFGFDESIKCPESIEEKELYLIWANQYATIQIDEEELWCDIEELRRSDNLTSKEYNAKWFDLISGICG